VLENKMHMTARAKNCAGPCTTDPLAGLEALP
jgi:hypothetical protein